jgi:tRNA G37 N-methylase Trm5
MMIRVFVLIGLIAVISVPTCIYAQEAPTRRPDVIFVPTPDDVVAAMLEVTNVTRNDVVYDLGCGDGRIAVAAANKGARAVCIDIDPQRIREANENVIRNGVEDRVRVVHADLFETDISEATVVTLYLLPSLNVRLIPTLQKMKPGTRVVSHAFDMGNCKPEKELDVTGRRVFYWTIPMNCQD